MAKASARAGEKADQDLTKAAEVMVIQRDPTTTLLAHQDAFDDALGLAIREATAFLRAEIPATDPEFARKWGIKASLVSTIMNTATKIDETNLKRVRTDGLAELMQQVKAVQEQRAARQSLLGLPPEARLAADREGK